METFNPLPADHPLVTNETHRCAICHERFKEGDVTTLIAVEATLQDHVCAALAAHAKCVDDLKHT